jgi:hypothetical protein
MDEKPVTKLGNLIRDGNILKDLDKITKDLDDILWRLDPRELNLEELELRRNVVVAIHQLKKGKVKLRRYIQGLPDIIKMI